MYGFVILGTILLLLTATIVRAAIRAGEDTGTALDPTERRDAAVEALRDLELEFQTGKLTEGEYRDMRRRLEREAIRARDEAEGGAPPEPTVSPSALSDESSRVCRSCGGSLAGDESFCSNCGAQV